MARKKIGDDDDLSSVKKKNDHARSEKVKDVFCGCIRIATVAIGIFLLVLVTGIVWHWFRIGDYSTMELLVKYLATGGGGMYLGYLKYSGIKLP